MPTVSVWGVVDERAIVWVFLWADGAKLLIFQGFRQKKWPTVVFGGPVLAEQEGYAQPGYGANYAAGCLQGYLLVAPHTVPQLDGQQRRVQSREARAFR